MKEKLTFIQSVKNYNFNNCELKAQIYLFTVDPT
jgi:hypothetical protein